MRYAIPSHVKRSLSAVRIAHEQNARDAEREVLLAKQRGIEQALDALMSDSEIPVRIRLGAALLSADQDDS